MNIPIDAYNELVWKMHALDQIIDLVKEYQYQERTDPGPAYAHTNRVKALVSDIEFELRKECGPTIEECPYAE